MRRRCFALARFVALAVLSAPQVLDAQRCSVIPTYGSARVSVGYMVGNLREGSTSGGILRGVYRNTSLEGRFENIDASWHEPHLGFVGGIDQRVVGRAAGVTLRQSVPLRDGFAALCLVVDVTSTALDGHESEVYELVGTRFHDEIAIGAGIALPFELSRRVRGALLAELRRVAHRSEDDEYGWSGRAVGTEVTFGAGFVLPRHFTLVAHAGAPIYDTYSNSVPKWKESGVPRFRLSLQYHFDLR